MVASSSPLKCTSPADIYLLLKSSDFTQHDLSPESVFEGCEDTSTPPSYELELVLRKWYHVDTSREFRCFVRQGVLIGPSLYILQHAQLCNFWAGVSQRDPNPYDYMLESNFKEKVKETISSFWKREILGKWATDDCMLFELWNPPSVPNCHTRRCFRFPAHPQHRFWTHNRLSILRSENGCTLIFL